MSDSPTKTPDLIASGDRFVGRTALAAGAVCVLLAGACAWWSHGAAAAHLRAERRGAGTVVARQMVAAVEPLLVRGDLTAARRVLLECRELPGLIACRLALPDGRIIADSAARNIEVSDLPAKWTGVLDPAMLQRNDGIEVVATPGLEVIEPVDVPKRGRLYLRLSLAEADLPFRFAEQTGTALLTVGSLLLLLVAYRRLRGRTASFSLIGDALAALASGNEPTSQLRLSETLGPEAVAWNRVIDRVSALERAEEVERARVTLGGMSSAARGDSNALDSAAAASAAGDLNTVVELLSTGVLLLDNKLHVRSANGAAAALLGVKRDEMVGGDALTLLPSDALADALRSIAAGSGERRSLEIDRTATGGGVLRVCVRPLRREDDGGALLTLEDVTQQRVADASRNSFVAQATHELRAPLTNMRLCLEAALEDDANDLEAITRHMNMLNDETRRLERLVAEMLSVAEIEAGAMSLRQDDVRLDRMFQDLEHDYASTAKEKNITLHFDLPAKLPVLRGDRDKLAATLHNLVNNAVKYTPEGGRITITPRQEADRFVIDVTDTGLGIGPADQPRIFEKFYRARDPRIAKISGTGLGLALSREVARLHGGDLTFKSELDRGTTFTLALPVAPQPA